MIKRNQYANAWANIVAIIMFFLTFFTAYFFAQFPLTTSFIKATVTLLVSMIVAKIIVFVWNNSMPSDDWRLLVKGAPDLPKHADLLISETDNGELENN